MNRPGVFLHLAPLLIPFGMFFGSGLILSIAQSTGWGAVGEYEGGAFSAYIEVLTDRSFWRNSWYSIRIAFLSTSGALVGGSILAWGIWQLPQKLRRMSSVYHIPLILPHITVAFLVLFLFSNRGLLGSLFTQLGAPELGANFLGTGNGWQIILSYIFKEIPFVMLMELAILQTIPEELMITAGQLGANRWYTYRRVVLPFLLPLIHTLYVILFLYSLGAFDIPYLLGRSRPAMIGMDIYRLYFERDLTYRPLAMARLVLLFLFSSAIIFVHWKAVRKTLLEGDN